jgi:hypothetical protein
MLDIAAAAPGCPVLSTASSSTASAQAAQASIVTMHTPSLLLPHAHSSLTLAPDGLPLQPVPRIRFVPLSGKSGDSGAAPGARAQCRRAWKGAGGLLPKETTK